MKQIKVIAQFDGLPVSYADDIGWSAPRTKEGAAITAWLNEKMPTFLALGERKDPNYSPAPFLRGVREMEAAGIITDVKVLAIGKEEPLPPGIIF